MEPFARKVSETRRFVLWYASLSAPRVRAAVMRRVDRLERGLFGDHRSVGGGVWELRIHFGPGIRVYYGERDGHVVFLLGGGLKAEQSRDIAQARLDWGALRGRA